MSYSKERHAAAQAQLPAIDQAARLSGLVAWDGRELALMGQVWHHVERAHGHCDAEGRLHLAAAIRALGEWVRGNRTEDADHVEALAFQRAAAAATASQQT